MTTLTDKELIKEIKERISSLDVRDNIERRAYEIALASLEADPVAYIFKHPAGKLFWALTDESNKEQPDVIPVYAAAPASVVPDNASEPLAYAYKELTPEIMRNQAAESNRGNEWTGNPDIDNAIIMLDRIDTLENCDDDRIEAVKAVLRRLAGNSPVIPGEVLSAIMKVARVRADFDDFDGDRRGIGDCLDEAEQELIVTINKYASQLAAEPIATNDVREQQTAVPPVPEIQADVAQAIENLKQKLVECNRYNYCADAVKGVEDACHAAMLQGIQPVSQTYKFPVNTPCQDAPAHIWLQTAGVWPEDGELSELTWCSHNQHHDDTLYVRADLVNGNYPVTPDGWISCSERMPDDGQHVIILCDGAFVLYAQYRDGEFFDIVRNGDEFFETQSRNVTDWMRLPEPPQEVNRG
ncbi:DUF551 domain-containing protein [Salmonella enterica subsp. enterica]|nr:DUF551 domain-containing protein [Salmonella enterica subsp. enterica]EDA3738386.1 DUF551 domain-containing protein [Salmonella enterica subsp. enterica serovar Typhimurium]HAC8558518.1 DUF551 domain-containing protein [Salmonella enterica]ECE6220157.1 DUF551 domain-containing protein [Salmonella enterica subsp. enterica]ECG1458426.1 DUF551 domain-containing protein [Salmonella enterica subsp. enterica]